MRITVVTAVLNGAATVAGCLRSVASQTHADVEHVVVDGGSRDGTRAIVERFPGRRGPFLSEPDRGLYDALNKGIRLATGEVVGVLGADDELAEPSVLSRVAGAMEDPSVDACYGDLVYVRRGDPSCTVRYWRAGERLPGAFRRGWMPPHPTFYARRALLEKAGGFDISFRIAADYELMLRLLERDGARTAYLPGVLVRMRLGGTSNRGLRNLLRKTREDRRAWTVNGLPGGTLAVLRKNLVKLPQFLLRPG